MAAQSSHITSFGIFCQDCHCVKTS